MLKGFRNFLLRGDVIVVAIGLIIALAFSGLVEAFTTSVLKPLIDAAASNGSASSGLGWTLKGQRIDLGAFIAAVVYFIVLIAVVYFAIVVPYRGGDAAEGDDGLRRAAADEDVPLLPVQRSPGRGDASACTARPTSPTPGVDDAMSAECRDADDRARR